MPTGFRIVDVTFVSLDRGWLLGWAPCRHEPCTAVLHTTDGGRTWRGGAAPAAYVPDDPGGRNVSDESRFITGMRFITASIGYAYGDHALFLTTNGGGSWVRQRGEAWALESGHAGTFRVDSDPAGCEPPACNLVVDRRLTGGGWTRTSAPVADGAGPTLTVSGDTVAMLVRRNPAGGAQDETSTLDVSTDDGRTWQQQHDPCDRGQPQEVDAWQLAGHGQTLVLSCQPRINGPSGAFLDISTDGGRSWRHRSLPSTSGYPSDVSVVATASIRVVLVDPHGLQVWTSDDGGQQWQPGYRQNYGGAPNIEVQFFGFETSTVARLVYSSGQAGDFPPMRTLYTTDDSGKHYAPHHFA